MERPATCGFLIKQIHDSMEKRANNTLRSRDLTMAQVSVLLELCTAPQKQMALKELERRLHVAQSTAAGIVSRLEQKGFVEGLGDAEDRRVKILRITPSGEACCRQADQSMEEAEAALLFGLTETERMIFQSLLERVSNNLQ